MIFKIIIFILALAMVISLFSSAFFLVKDKGNTERAQRTLRIRVSIAFLLLITVAIGVYSGQLSVNSPWG
jgi:NADH:ubiquinone oxidoreductase subunit 6 (subunit J)